MLLTPYERDFCQLWFTVNKLRFDVQVVVLIGNALEFTNVYIYIYTPYCTYSCLLYVKWNCEHKPARQIR